MTESTGDRERKFAYDAVGRVARVTDRPTGSACVTRAYTYDANSNRASSSVYPGNAQGDCSTSTSATAQNLTYDRRRRTARRAARDCGCGAEAAGGSALR